MIVVLVNGYVAILALFVWLRFIPFNLFWKVSPIIVALALLIAVCIKISLMGLINGLRFSDRLILLVDPQVSFGLRGRCREALKIENRQIVMGTSFRHNPILHCCLSDDRP